MKDYTVFEKNIDGINRILESYCTEIKVILRDMNGNDVQYMSRKHLFMYLERYSFAWTGIKDLILTKNFNHFYHPIPILLRSIVSDSITAFYLLFKLGNIHKETRIPLDEQNFLDTCKGLDKEFIKAMFEIIGMMDIDDNKKNDHRKKIRDNMNPSYSDFFAENNGIVSMTTVTRFDIKKSASEIKDQINLANNSYYFFKYFSQYEHCSPFTKQYLYDNKRENYCYFLAVLYGTLIISHNITEIINFKKEHSLVLVKIKEDLEAILKETNISLR